MTKYHRLGSLNDRKLFLTVLEAVKSESMVSAFLGSGEDFIPGLQAVPFCCVLTWWKETQQALGCLFL